MVSVSMIHEATSCRSISKVFIRNLINLRVFDERSIRRDSSRSVCTVDGGKNYEIHSVAKDTGCKKNIWLWGGKSSMFGAASTKDKSFLHEPERLEDFSNSNITSISAGLNHSAFTVDGRVFTFGDNSYGQLGLKLKDGFGFSATPEEVQIPEFIVSVVCGDYHTIALSEHGSLWVWGWSGSMWSGAGGLGLGYKGNIVTNPSKVDINDSRSIQVACGAQHTIVLTEDNKLFGTGKGEFGRLGRGHNGDQLSFEEIQFFSHPENMLNQKIVKVVCGASHSAAVGSEGTVWVWGRNDSGQLGLEDNMGDMYSSEMYPRKVKFLDLERVQINDISSGERHMLALSASGVIYFWGARAWLSPRPVTMEPSYRNSSIKQKIVQVEAAGSHYFYNFAISEKGDLYSWGKQKSGCLLRTVKNDANEPCKLSPEIFNNEPVTDIKCSRHRALALTRSGN